MITFIIATLIIGIGIVMVQKETFNQKKARPEHFISSYMNVNYTKGSVDARAEAVNNFLKNHWKGLVVTIIGIIGILFIWNSAVSQTNPDGTYHSGDLAAVIGMMSFTNKEDTLTFNSDGTVNYSATDKIGWGTGATDNGTYYLADGYLTIKMQISGNHTFEYSKDFLGDLTLKDSATGNSFSFTK